MNAAALLRLGGEVQYLCDNDIPFYLYSVEEYEELVLLVPDWEYKGGPRD